MSIGPLWRRFTQVGKETTYGLPAVATRNTYLTNPAFTLELAPRPQRFGTRTRDNQRAVTHGPVTAGGTATLPVSPAELLEWLEITFGPGPVTTPAGATLARRHTYKPTSSTPSSMTVEYHDGARLKRALGVMGNQLTIAGTVLEANTATLDLFAANYVDWAGPATTLAERTPAFLEGWQTYGYLDPIAGTPGTTQLTDTLINWTFTFNNNLGRKYWAQNTLETGSLVTGELDITAQLTLEAASPQAATEVQHWIAGSERLLRLEFIGPADEIETGHPNLLWVDVPMVWGTGDLNAEDAGTRVYTLDGMYVYSPTLAAGCVVTAQTSRALAFAA